VTIIVSFTISMPRECFGVWRLWSRRAGASAIQGSLRCLHILRMNDGQDY
jgi:hypothetical protein